MNEPKAIPVDLDIEPVAEVWLDELQVEADREKRDALANFKFLDVHTWSDHPEVNQFVNAIYDAHFAGRKINVQKRHLKVVLLDLYVTWCEDPERVVALSRNNNEYRAKSLYNELHISRVTIEVVDRLRDVGLIEQADGFKDRDTGIGRYSRIWPTDRLVDEFRKARFGPLEVGYLADRVSVILRKGECDDEENEKGRKRDIEYEPDDNTRRMSAMLADYNALLVRSFIDIPTLERPWIEIEQGDELSRLVVGQGQRHKFVRRIFNRGSFECGGRFYGGWWQRCPKEWRKRIFINDTPTTEIDFSGLHVVMLYAQQGIPYWAEFGEDPYELPEFDFLEDKDERRTVAKGLMLVLLNASDRKKAYSAFRKLADKGTRAKRFTNDQLELVHEALARKHPQIEEFFGADAGIRLMNRDAMITERILTTFLQRDVPALSLHDSYIVPTGYEDFLREEMCNAFEEVMGIPLVDPEARAVKENLERVDDLWGQLMAWMPYAHVQGQDEDEHAYRERVHPGKTARYLHAWEQFKDWQGKA